MANRKRLKKRLRIGKHICLHLDIMFQMVALMAWNFISFFKYLKYYFLQPIGEKKEHNTCSMPVSMGMFFKEKKSCCQPIVQGKQNSLHLQKERKTSTIDKLLRIWHWCNHECVAYLNLNVYGNDFGEENSTRFLCQNSCDS